MFANIVIQDKQKGETKMKKKTMLRGVLIAAVFGLVVFAGCAEKKAVVTESASSQPAAPTATTPPQTDPLAAAQAALQDINFDFDKSDIRPDARGILKANADFLIKNNDIKIIIEGHCDERGTAEYNMALGERRAQEAKKYLINLGVDASRMKTISYGEERPLDPASNEEAWAKNRRAHFAVIK